MNDDVKPTHHIMIEDDKPIVYSKRIVDDDDDTPIVYTKRKVQQAADDDDDDKPLPKKAKKEEKPFDHQELALLIKYFLRDLIFQPYNKGELLELMGQMRADPSHVQKLVFQSGVHFAFTYMLLFMGKYPQFYTYLLSNQRQYSTHLVKLYKRLPQDLQKSLRNFEMYTKLDMYTKRLEQNPGDVSYLANTVHYLVILGSRMGESFSVAWEPSLTRASMLAYVREKVLPAVASATSSSLRFRMIKEIAVYADEVVFGTAYMKGEKKATLQELGSMVNTCQTIQEKTVATRLRKLEARNILPERYTTELCMNDLVDEMLGALET